MLRSIQVYQAPLYQLFVLIKKIYISCYSRWIYVGMPTKAVKYYCITLYYVSTSKWDVPQLPPYSLPMSRTAFETLDSISPWGLRIHITSTYSYTLFKLNKSAMIVIFLNRMINTRDFHFLFCSCIFSCFKCRLSNSVNFLQSNLYYWNNTVVVFYQIP